jgi:hypothetical protein
VTHGIRLDEFRKGMQRLGVHMTDAEVDALFARIDHDNNGVRSFFAVFLPQTSALLTRVAADHRLCGVGGGAAAARRGHTRILCGRLPQRLRRRP